jgi:hypothetical protein
VLTGRGVELDQLGAALDKARAGSSGARVITGEAGMGKTSLVQAIRDQATDFLVLSMRGIESESTIGGAGLLELLQPVLDRLDGLPGPLRGALLGVLGFAEPKGDQFAVSAALTTLLSTVALDRPLLVVVDDVSGSTRSPPVR